MDERQKWVLSRIAMAKDALKRATDNAKDDCWTVDLIYVDRQLNKAKQYVNEALAGMIPWASSREDSVNPPPLYDAAG